MLDVIEIPASVPIKTVSHTETPARRMMSVSNRPRPRPKPQSPSWRLKLVGYAIVLSSLSLTAIALTLVWLAFQLPEILDVASEAIAGMGELAEALDGVDA